MQVVLPFCNKDEELALRQLEWAKKLDKGIVPYKCLVVHDDATEGNWVMDMASQYFSKVEEMCYGRWPGNKDWPFPQNFQFQMTAWHIQGNESLRDAWFWWEADATPLRRGWLDILSKAHAKGGKPFSGHKVGEPFGHMTGVGIYPWDTPNRTPGAMLALGTPWDIASKRDVVPRQLNEINHLIQHIWERGGNPFTFSSMKEVNDIIIDTAVVFHRCKDGSLIETLNGSPVIPKIKGFLEKFISSIIPVKNSESAVKTPVRFTVSILAHGKIDSTRKCLESVFATVKEPFQLILTDNCSKDGTRELFEDIAKERDNIDVIVNRSNLGFVEPNIKALEMARGEYFVMLNNDTIVPDGWLEKLADPFSHFPSAALTSPYGGCTAWDAKQFKGKTGALEYLEGACLCAKVDIVRKHGLFSPYIKFAYCEDADLSLRLRALGYSLHLADFTIQHARSTTSRGVPNIRVIANANVSELTRRWGHYLKVRRLDYSIAVKRSAAIGDVLLTTPVIRALKKKLPMCSIFVETRFPEIFKGNPYVDGAYLNLGRTSPETQVIDLNMAYETMSMTHIVEAYMRVAAVDGDNKTELFPSDEDIGWAKSELPMGVCDSFCVIHADRSTWPGKTWPKDRWVEISDFLKGLGYGVVAVGRDLESASAIRPDVNLVGRGTIQQLAAIMGECKLFVGGDSFPMHCAQAMGVPVVALFGATLPRFILTSGSKSYPVVADASVKCSGERHRVTGQTNVPCEGKCMESITVEDVINAIESARHC